MSDSTSRIYPDVNRPGGSLTAPPSAMGEKLAAEAEKWRRMSEEAIAESERSTPPLQPAPPQPPPQVNWDEEIDHEALVTRRRQPTDWVATTVVVGATAVQVVTYRPNRKSVLILNTGANPVVVGATEGAVANGSSATFSIAASTSLSLDMEAAVWGSSSAGTTLQVVETYYGRASLNRSVASLMRLARARVGPPKAEVPVPPAKKGEKGLL